MKEIQPAKNVWEVTPNFAHMWKSNNNYGYNLVIDGLLASVSPSTEKRSGRQWVTYSAYIHTPASMNVPHQLRHSGFTSMTEGQQWCEEWLTFLYRHIQLQKQVECYESSLKYYQDELGKVQDHINEQKWEEIRQSFRDALGEGGEA